jgi:erythromycin esterase-like protein
METLEEIIKQHKNNGIKNPKIIIWAHNSHIGNSAATQMSVRGEFNIGHLIKEKFGKQAYSLGFTTYQGTVSAAAEWHMPVERKNIRTALSNSYEDLFHSVGLSKFFLPLEDKDVVPKKLLERAIGVIYAPLTERQSHYFYASLADQFDGVIHYDTTSALEPLEKTTLWVDGEVPETYPTGL